MTLILGIYLLVLVPLYLSRPEAPALAIRVGVTVAAALVLLCTHILLRTSRRAQKNAQLLMGIGLYSILLQILTNMVELRNPHLTSDVMLWVVGAALVLRSRTWYIPSILVGCLAWAFSFQRAAPTEPLFHWIIGMVSAFLVSIITHAYLAVSHRQQEDLRIQDRIQQRTNEQLIAMLVDTVESNRALQGLIPICAQCKKIRNDEGYWQQVEQYIQERSEARFSHGLCPPCAAAMLAELDPRQPPPPKG